MSQSPNHNLDHVLTQIYSQQAGLYEQLRGISDGLPDAFSQRQGTEAVLGDMSTIMDQITQLNEQLAPIRDQWTSSASKPSAELAQAIKRVEQLILGLIKQIDAAQGSAQKAKNAMLPTMSEENARRQMRAAYTSASRNR